MNQFQISPQNQNQSDLDFVQIKSWLEDPSQTKREYWCGEIGRKRYGRNYNYMFWKSKRLESNNASITKSMERMRVSNYKLG